MQFDVYEYKRTSHYQLFVDVQSNILDTPGFRMAIPLVDASLLSEKVSKELLPIVQLNGTAYRLKTDDVVSVSKSVFGDKVGSLAIYETEIKDAINILFWGV
ncbi:MULTISPECIES: CcdB family protein [Enterobacterales]|jgi:toxin CcdB|uniref:CcdB family protein n=1 Tax=Enterobacterales TaxID=91347 RepID=UPI00053811D6|nr:MULTISPECIES: CcdB family protein [Enterobacterales]KGT87423.1 plasmid maintenance protein CcdB [Enterobacter cancerogenus]MXP55132.1 plasmid maintenance protein CcdB [Pantoea sp. Seng]SNY73850.1 toxin CcdB [Pantoea sp. GL120224-02]